MPFTVSGYEQQPLVCVHRLLEGFSVEACSRRSGVDPGTRSFRAALLKMIESFGRGPMASGHQGPGACFSGFGRNHRENHRVDFRHVAINWPDRRFHILSVTFWKRKSSASVMCSSVSATDQRSGAGLNFICASERSLVAAITPSRVCSRYFVPLSRSVDVSVCPNAAMPRIATN